MDIFLREWTFWGLDKAKNAKIPTEVSHIKWARIPCFASGIGRNNRSGGFADSIKGQPCSRLAPQFIQLKDLRLFCQFSLALGAREARALLREQGGICVHCHDCNTDYTFDEDDLRKLFGENA